MLKKKRCDCGRTFEYEPAFYSRRGFGEPKRCPMCAAEKRGRPRSKERTCTLELANVVLDIPEIYIQSPTYLKRKDKKSDEERITCLRFQVRSRKYDNSRGYITVYDQRNSDPNSFAPLSGALAQASVRVMKVKSESYTYIVLDYPDKSMRPEASLVVLPEFFKDESRILFCKEGFSLDDSSKKEDRWRLYVLEYIEEDEDS